jgi:hypothetical protein
MLDELSRMHLHGLDTLLVQRRALLHVFKCAEFRILRVNG